MTEQALEPEVSGDGVAHRSDFPTMTSEEEKDLREETLEREEEVQQ
jgi:hypothetical protein